MSREEQKIIDYMVVCINEFADTFNLKALLDNIDDIAKKISLTPPIVE